MSDSPATKSDINGPVRRWKDDHGIYWAENEWLRLAWAKTDDPAKEGSLGFHGPDEICVEFISPKNAADFDRKWSLNT